MPLRLQGERPQPGVPDRRYYLIDVQVDMRRVRISSGTRDRVTAERKEQQVIDAVRENPLITKEELLVMLRGQRRGQALARRTPSAERAVAGATLGSVAEEAKGFCWKGTADERKTIARLALVVAEVGADTPIVNIDRGALEHLVRTLRAKGNSPATINRKLSVLSVVLKYAADRPQPLILHVPRLPRQVGERRRSLALDEHEFEEIIAAIEARDLRKQSVKGGHPVKRDAHLYVRLFRVLYETGMRPGEALPLPWRAIKFERREIEIRNARHLGHGTKTNRSRVIPMTDRCFELLTEVRGNGAAGPFSALEHRRANDHWLQARRGLGITDPDCVPYATRHSLVTKLLEETGDLNMAKDWAGHSTIRLTADTYGHVKGRHLVRGADALNRRAQVTRNSEIQDRIESETGSSLAGTNKKSH